MLGFITRHSALETTAAEAQVEAPTAKIAREIEMNARQEQTAAEQAAAVAGVSRVFHIPLTARPGSRAFGLINSFLLTDDGQGIYRRANDRYR